MLRVDDQALYHWYVYLSLQTVRLARCYKSKLSAINVGLALTRCLSPSDVASRYSFELFINVILLNLQTGRFSTALKHFDQARRPIDPEQTATMNNNKFSGKVIYIYTMLLLFGSLVFF